MAKGGTRAIPAPDMRVARAKLLILHYGTEKEYFFLLRRARMKIILFCAPLWYCTAYHNRPRAVMVYSMHEIRGTNK